MDSKKRKPYWDYAKNGNYILEGGEIWADHNVVYVTYPLKDELKIPGIIPLTSRPIPKEVIFNPPATIVYWTDGTRTVVKCSEEDVFSEEVGFAMCFMEKCLGNKLSYHKYIRKALEGANRYGNKDNSIELSDEDFESLAAVLGRLKTAVLSSFEK